MKNDFMGTFMTIATSFPELFVSCLGTFVTEGDIGVGTIVGSAVFNILAVPALCGFFARTAIQLEWWSVTRDCIFYGLSVFALVAVIYDNQIMWYEAASLIAFYGIYLACNFVSVIASSIAIKLLLILGMYRNDTMSEKIKIFARNVRWRIRRQPYREVAELTPLFIRENFSNAKSTTILELSEPLVKVDEEAANDHCATNPWRIPNDTNKIYFLIRWPITVVLWCTIPDSRRFKGFYIFTFVNSVLWIGCISYFVVFISTNVSE